MTGALYVGRAALVATLVGATGARAERAAEPTAADTSAASARASAEALFQEGVQLSEQNRLPEACEKFEASEALDVAVGTLLRLADCRERTGRLASAWSRFREAGSLAQAQGMPDRARIAAVRSAALEPKLTRLTIDVAEPAPEGLTLKLDETTVPRASWGSPLPLDAGTVDVQATAPGYEPYRRYVEIPEGQGARVRITIPKLQPERTKSAQPRQIIVRSAAPERAPAPAMVPDNRGYAARVAGVSLVVMGGAGALTAGGLAIAAKKRSDAAREHCAEGRQSCTPRGVQLRDDADRLANYAVLSAAVGGSLLLSGVVVYLLAPSDSRREALSLRILPDAHGGVALRATAAF